MAATAKGVSVLVESFARAWRATNKSQVTCENYVRVYRAFEACSGPLEAATRRSLRDFIIAERERCSDAWGMYVYRALRAFYRWAVDEEEIRSNPMDNVAPPRVAEPVVRTATKADVDALLAVRPERTMAHSRDRAIVLLLWSSGMRRSELAALTVDDIDVDGRVALVRRSKNGTTRRVPFAPDAAVALDVYLRRRRRHRMAADPALWLGTKGVLRSDGIRKAIRSMAADAGVDVTAHSFRRGFACTWLRAGGSQVSLQAAAGWSTNEMVRRYTRQLAEEVARDEHARIFAG